MVHISLQEKLEYKLSWEAETSTGQKLKELLWLQYTITIGVSNLKELLHKNIISPN